MPTQSFGETDKYWCDFAHPPGRVGKRVFSSVGKMRDFGFANPGRTASLTSTRSVYAIFQTNKARSDLECQREWVFRRTFPTCRRMGF